MSAGANKDFADSIKAVASSAVQNDSVFTLVRQNLEELSKIPAGWPQDISRGHEQQVVHILGYLTKWEALTQTWKQCLPQSKELAVQTAEVLQRFDSDCLDVVNRVVTEQDRLAAIQSLQNFLDDMDKQDKSATLSRMLLELKRDVSDLVGTMDQWPPLDPTAQGRDLMADPSSDAVSHVNSDQRRIDGLNQDIKNAEALMVETATLEGIYFRRDQVNVNYNQWKAVQDLEQERRRQIGYLRESRGLLEGKMPNIEVELKLQVDRWQSEVDITLNNLLSLATIWSKVRNKAVELESHVKGVMDASYITRMKLEVQQAKTVCDPLRDGLAQYATVMGTYLQSVA